MMSTSISSQAAASTGGGHVKRGAVELAVPLLVDLSNSLLDIHDRIVGCSGNCSEVATQNTVASTTDLDVELTISKRLKECLGRSFVIVGEESVALGQPVESRGEQTIWLDPIDGTRLLLEGRSDYAMTFAVSVSGVLRAGVVSFPGSRDRYVVLSGGGLFKNGRLLKRRGPTIIASRVVALRRRDHFDADRIFAAVEAADFEIERVESTARRFVEITEGRISGFAKQVGSVGSVPRLWGLAAGLLICSERGHPVWFDPRRRLLAIGEDSFIKVLQSSGMYDLRQTCVSSLWQELLLPFRTND